MIAYVISAFLLGLIAAVPLSFRVSRGFRYRITLPAWRFDPAVLDAEASDTW